MSKIEYFHHVNNKIDMFRHLARVQKENRNAVAYDCRDVAIILKKVTKKVFEPMFVLERQWKEKANHEVLGLCKRSLRLRDVIDFRRNWPFIS